MESQKIPNSQRNLKKNKAGSLPDLNLYYKSIVKPYGTGIKIDTWTNGTELKAQK